MTDPNVFLLMWCEHGLETCINVTEWEKRRVWDALSDTKTTDSIGTVMSLLMLRARSNSHRHYEIYTVTVDPEMTEIDLKDMFESSPQTAVDLIRKRGVKIYSDRVTTKPVIV
jgi:hypothetical protein